MKALIVVLLCLPLIACQTQPDPRDARIAALEQRVTQLENQNKTAAQSDEQRISSLGFCLQAAEDWYNSNLRLNAVSTRKTSISVPLPAMQQALSVKNGKVEQCKLLYGAH